MKLIGSITELLAAVFRKDGFTITLEPNQATTYTRDAVIQLPPGTADQILVSTDAVQTLTNKTIDGLDNTITNIPLSSVSGTLLIANGGTNSSTALLNGRIIISSAGSLVETAALTPNTVLISDGSGLPISSSVTAAELAFLSGVSSDIQTQIDSKVSKSGDSMSGNLDMNGFSILSIANPTTATGAANKQYVDNLVVGLSWKNPVRLLSDSNVSLSGLSAIDSVTPVSGDRIAVVGQSTASENGIYIANSGSWTRSVDADTGAEILQATFFVEEGTVYADTGWTLATNAPITVGTTPLSFIQFSGGGSTNAGTGLTLTGNTLSVNMGAGIIELPTGEVGIDLYSSSGLLLTLDGTTPSSATGAQLAVRLNGSTIDRSSSGIKVADNSLTNTQIASTAAIAGTKISPDFGSQDIVTTATISGESLFITGTAGSGFIDLLRQTVAPTTPIANHTLFYSRTSNSWVFQGSNGFEIINSSALADESAMWSYPPTGVTHAATFLSEALSQTVTNKTIDGSLNTITNISLTTAVSGILPVANGGLGVNASAFTGVLKAASGVFSASTIVDADVSSSAAIAGTKISPNFGGQAVTTTNQGTFQSVLVNGANGFLELAPSGLTSAPASGLRLFSGVADALSIYGASGFKVVLSWAGFTSDHALTFPDLTDNIVSRTSVDTLQNKSLFDNTVSFVAHGDVSKKLFFNLTGATTNTIMTLASNQTTNRVLTLPDAFDTLVARNTTDTLTNKTINGVSNTLTVRAASDITGILPVANGGTGTPSGNSGGILGYTASGTLASSDELIISQVVIGGGAGATPTTLAAGSTGNVLTMVAGIPAWAAPSFGGSGTVTSIDISGGTTGLTTSGGPVTTSGTITLAGILIRANGGTGISSTATFPASGIIVTEAATETLTNKTLTGNTAVNLISGSGTFVLNTSGTITVPNATDTLATLTGTETFSNKTVGLANGTVGAPSLNFTADADGTGTGIYRIAANNLGFSANGIAVGDINAIGSWTVGPSNTSNFSSPFHILNGALVAGGTGSTDESKFMLIGSNIRNSNFGGTPRTAGIGGSGILFDSRTSDTVGALTFVTNLAASGAGAAAQTMGTITQAGSWTIGPLTAVQHTIQANRADGNFMCIVNNSSSSSTAHAMAVTTGATDSGTAAFQVATGGSTKFEVVADGQLQVNPTNWASGSITEVCVNVTTGLGKLIKFSSSRRYKHEIQDLTFDSAKIFLLNPRQFRWNADDTLDFGFIAEEVAAVMPEAAIYAVDENGLVLDEDGNPRLEAVKYKQLVAPIIDQLRKLRNEFDAYIASHP